MGGSLGLALRAHADAPVIGVDPDPEALRVALAVGAITEAAPSVEEAAGRADAVVLAAPVPLIPDLAERALRSAGPDCVVTDMGSTKAGVMAAMPPAVRERFIGGHPVCGGERPGVAFARQELFRGATWFLTPAPEARSDLFQRLHALVASVGTGLWLAALNVRYRDVRVVTPFLVQLWLLATPVAYPASLLREPWRTVNGLNPMAGVVEGVRWAILGTPTEPGRMLVVSVVTACVVLVGGAMYFRRMERTFADRI